ncbi:MAG TPA: hypothetical protein VGH22_15335 [Candidatus Binatia bacterium]|jgi:hypothetical protein
MSRLIVAVFNNGDEAYLAASAIKKLCQTGELLIYSLTVIVNEMEEIVVVESMTEVNETILGKTTRALTQLLAEPYWHRIDKQSIAEPSTQITTMGVEPTFVGQVTRQLSPGRAGIITEIEEDIGVLANVIESSGGIVFHCVRNELIDLQISQQLERMHRQLQDLEARLAHASEESNGELKRELDLCRSKFTTIKNQARCHATSIRREAEAKIVCLQEQAAKAKAERRAKLEQLAEELRVDYVNRATKLSLAWRIASEVLAAACLLLPLLEIAVL